VVPETRWLLIFGASGDKAIDEMLRALLPLSAHVIVTRSYHPRAAAPDALADKCAEIGHGAEIAVDPRRALEQAFARWEPGWGILATGSVFIAADVREAWAHHAQLRLPEGIGVMNPGKGRDFTQRRKGAKEFKKLSDLATWREPIGVGALRWILLLLVLMPQPVGARPAADAPSPDALAAFFDTRIPAQLAQYNIPGAAVAVVADGQVVFAQGYGYTNSETCAPVVAEKTLFHIGSVTKLFTWTAIMQLVEQGQLDLDADINTYLSAIQFPPTFSEPIRLKHLLTHTPGLEDRLSNLLRVNRNDGLPLEDYIVANNRRASCRPARLSATPTTAARWAATSFRKCLVFLTSNT
jgi:hypothetical protein